MAETWAERWQRRHCDPAWLLAEGELMAAIAARQEKPRHGRPVDREFVASLQGRALRLLKRAEELLAEQPRNRQR